MSWIQTFSGKKAYPLDLKPDQVCIEDVAQGLSMTARFRGQTREFYSVAQHSCMVSRGVPEHLALAGLLHDAGEVYLFDAARPIKGAVRFQTRADGLESMQLREDKILMTVFGALGVAWPSLDEWREIEEADARALMTEARDLLGPTPAPWAVSAQPYPDVVAPRTWKESRTVFLNAFWFQSEKKRGAR